MPGAGGAEPGAGPGWIRVLQMVQCAHGIWIYIDDPQRGASSGPSIRRVCPPGESTRDSILCSLSQFGLGSGTVLTPASMHDGFQNILDVRAVPRLVLTVEPSGTSSGLYVGSTQAF